jgi:hypothetical protein
MQAKSRQNSLKARKSVFSCDLHMFAGAEEAERLTIGMSQIHCQGANQNEK